MSGKLITPSRPSAICIYAVCLLTSLAFAAMGQTPVKVNRSVPQVEPPKTALEFSAQPTTQEILRARVFEEPLVPIGGEPTAEENSALAAALLGYAKRSGPDDFASLTGFLEKHPKSPWCAALLTDLGLEYYNTARSAMALPIMFVAAFPSGQAFSHAASASE